MATLDQVFLPPERSSAAGRSLASSRSPGGLLGVDDRTGRVGLPRPILLFPQSFATQWLEDGIRTVQELLGREDAAPTMIGTHVLNRGPGSATIWASDVLETEDRQPTATRGRTPARDLCRQIRLSMGAYPPRVACSPVHPQGPCRIATGAL